MSNWKTGRLPIVIAERVQCRSVNLDSRGFLKTSHRRTNPNMPPNKSDKNAMFRQWRVLNIVSLHEDGITVKDLATQFSASQRTIQRDLELLQSVGFPLDASTGAHGRKRWRCSAGLIPTINLNLTEAAAIYLGRKLMEPLAGTDLWVGAQEAFQKFECAFDERTHKYLDKLAQEFHITRFGTGDYSNYSEIIDTLMMAIEDRKVVTLAYQSQQTTEPAERDVHPYQLIYHLGNLYLVAWAVEHGEFRNYKVDRISNAQVDLKSLPFVPVPFELDQYLVGSFGIYRGKRKPTKVQVLFQPSVVRYVEEKHWHESERLTRQPDGTLLAEFVLTSFGEVKSWVLGFGPQARVLEPAELIQQIRDDLAKTAERYQSAPSAAPPARVPRNARFRS